MESHKLALLLSLFCVGCHAESLNDKDEFIDIFPPKWHSGDIMKTTKHADIDNALTDVHRAASILESRSVAIGIACESGHLLKSPQTKLLDGVEQSTLPEEFKAGETLLVLFKKYYGHSKSLVIVKCPPVDIDPCLYRYVGQLQSCEFPMHMYLICDNWTVPFICTVGVKGVYCMMTYNINGTNLMLAIMVSNPFDSLVYKIKYNMKIYPDTLAVNGDLVKHMLEYGAWTPQGYQDRTEYGVNLKGVITDNRRSKLIVRINSEGADEHKDPSRVVGCGTKGVLPGKKCWKECDLGFCWTEYSCENSSGCSQQMSCAEGEGCQT